MTEDSTIQSNGSPNISHQQISAGVVNSHADFVQITSADVVKDLLYVWLLYTICFFTCHVERAVV